MECVVQCFDRFLALLAPKQNHLFHSRQQQLALVEKIDLKDAIAQPKHDGVLGLEPLLHENEVVFLLEFAHVFFVFGLLLQIHFKSFEQETLLGEIPVLRQLLLGEEGSLG